VKGRTSQQRHDARAELKQGVGPGGPQRERAEHEHAEHRADAEQNAHHADLQPHRQDRQRETDQREYGQRIQQALDDDGPQRREDAHRRIDSRSQHRPRQLAHAQRQYRVDEIADVQDMETVLR